MSHGQTSARASGAGDAGATAPDTGNFGATLAGGGKPA